MNEEVVYKKIKDGIREFFEANKFKKAIIGLSGGIDSALSSVLVVDVLGTPNLHPIFMPSEFTSETSRKNAYKLCKNLDIELTEININSILKEYLEILNEQFPINHIQIPEENLQARIRGNILMWFANRRRALVIAPGNRSEILTGYCTLYGDTVGAIAPIGDLYKTEVYQLARWINRKQNNPIPESILEQEPSAELNKDQRDEDELHPYDILDIVLKFYVDEEKSIKEIVCAGYDREVVEDIVNRVKRNRFKVKQLPPVVKLG